jgi:ribonucleoside-diphosphate reductase beta chain
MVVVKVDLVPQEGYKLERDIFKPRKEFKPFEYPELLAFQDAINHSYWLVSEWNFISDMQDFQTQLNPVEREIVRKALLAISQIEVAVKRYWTKIGDVFAKPEIEQIGVTFGESEVRHANAYSHLLEVLNLNDDFSRLLEVPEIRGRVDYLQKHIAGNSNAGIKRQVLNLALFSLFVENVSLFSQFLIVKSFNKYRNVLKDIDNVIQATQKEEQIHAMFGAQLINIVRKERPDWFDDTFYMTLYEACDKAFEAEDKIVEWIFQGTDLSFLTRRDVKEFLKNRFNQGLELIGGRTYFGVDKEVVSRLQWFEDEIAAEVNTDFFYKKPVTYSKKVQPITAEDLF